MFKHDTDIIVKLFLNKKNDNPEKIVKVSY